MQTQRRTTKVSSLGRWRRSPIFGGLVILTTFALFLFISAKTVLQVREIFDYNRPDAQTITVEGEGFATIVPDIATINLGIETKSNSTESAQDENTAKTNTLIERLKALGVPSEDIKTTNYNVREYKIRNPESNEYETKGWIVSQNLSLRIIDLTLIPAVIQVAGQGGVTNIYGLQFKNSDLGEVKQEARDQAIESAKKQADSIAKALGVKVLGVVEYNEFNNGGIGPFMERSFAVSDSIEEIPTIEEGSSEIKINVSVTYQLEN